MSDAGSCSMKKWRKDETDFMLVEAALDGRGRSGCVDAQRLKHISAAASRRCRPRTMLRYRQTCTCNHKGRRCRNVKGFRSARSSARCIDEARVTRSQWHCTIPHCFGNSRELIEGLAFYCQTGKRGRYLCVCSNRVQQTV